MGLPLDDVLSVRLIGFVSSFRSSCLTGDCRSNSAWAGPPEVWRPVGKKTSCSLHFHGAEWSGMVQSDPVRRRIGSGTNWRVKFGSGKVGREGILANDYSSDTPSPNLPRLLRPVWMTPAQRRATKCRAATAGEQFSVGAATARRRRRNTYQPGRRPAAPALFFLARSALSLASGSCDLAPGVAAGNGTAEAVPSYTGASAIFRRS